MAVQLRALIKFDGSRICRRRTVRRENKNHNLTETNNFFLRRTVLRRKIRAQKLAKRKWWWDPPDMKLKGLGHRLIAIKGEAFALVTTRKWSTGKTTTRSCSHSCPRYYRLSAIMDLQFRTPPETPPTSQRIKWYPQPEWYRETWASRKALGNFPQHKLLAELCPLVVVIPTATFVVPQTHTEIFSKSYYIKLKSECIYSFPIDL